MCHNAEQHVHQLRIQWRDSYGYDGYASPIHHGRYILTYGDQKMRVRKPLFGEEDGRLRRAAKAIIKLHDLETNLHRMQLEKAQHRTSKTAALVKELQPVGETKEQQGAGQTVTVQDPFLRALALIERM